MSLLGLSQVPLHLRLMFHNCCNKVVFNHRAPPKQAKWLRYLRALRKMMMVQPGCLDEESGEWKMVQKSFQLFLKELNATQCTNKKAQEGPSSTLTSTPSSFIAACPSSADSS